MPAGRPASRTAVASPDKKAFLLRVDPLLWAELERLAAAELRSVNGQVEFLLREALARRSIQPKIQRKTRPQTTS